MTAAEKIQELIDMIAPQTKNDSDTLKMLFYYADVRGKFASDEDWAALCEYAVELDNAHDLADSFKTSYDTANAKGPANMIKMFRRDLLDNYILAAVAARNMNFVSIKGETFIPCNAYNKHEYKGLQDEFAVMRFLHWAGCDINAADESGMTALHYFAQMKPPPGSNPRAVEWLIKHGANIHAKNSQGDTPIQFLCGVDMWTEEINKTFGLLHDAGAKATARMADGKTAIDYMEDQNKKNPCQARDLLIQHFRIKMAG